jgi:E3 ubiquitin-protein ligase RFWD2
MRTRNAFVCPQVFVYYRALAKPIAKRLFSNPGGGGGAEGPQFISAVAWKPQAQTLLAANSQGSIKVMQLTS